MNKFIPAHPPRRDAIVRTDRGEALLLPTGEFATPEPLLDPEPTESAIWRYWRILVKRRWVVLGVVLVCLLGGILTAMLTQRMYSATATLEIAREAARVVNMDEAQPSRGVDPEFYQTQYSLLKSRSLAESVVRSLRLDQNEQFLTGFGAADPATLPKSRTDRARIATGIVLANTEILPVRMSGVVNVRYSSPDPATAANVANALATNFIESNLSRRFDATAYAREFLQNRLAEVRQRLEESERRAVAYAGQNQIVNIAPVSSAPGQPQAEQSLVSASLAEANASLAQARTARIAAENRFRQALRTPPTEALQNPALNALREQRATLNAQYQRQLSDFGPDYPPVLALRAQIAELDKQVNTEGSRIGSTVLGSLEAQYRAALASERQLSGVVQQLTGGAIDLRRRSIQYNIFQREVDTNRALYDALLQRFKEVGIAGGVGTNNISVVDRAVAPTAPFRPNIMLNIVLSLLIGLGLGVLVALLLEQLDDFTIAPHDFQNKLGIPLLGAVPVAEKGAEPVKVLADSKSPMSEAYFSVLTALRFSTSHGTPQTILMTSTQPAEGKSTSAYALAQGLARVGNRVLLIDGDMRNPSLHKILGTANQGGFSNLLIGDGTIEDHALPTGVTNFMALTAGPIPPNPSELLSGQSLEQVLEDAARRFDHVIVDAPPVLGLADAPLLARAVEATVFVMEARRTRTGQARQALHRLMAVRASIAGAVLTKLNSQSAGYGYGYGYDYNYGR